MDKKNSVSTLREKHVEFLKNSPFKKTLKLSKKERKSIGLPPNKYYEREWELTMNPATGKPEPFKVLDLQKERNQTKKSYLAKNPGDEVSNSWEERGPNNVGGRTRAILFDPNDVTNKRVFAGGVSGGLWVNDDITDSNSAWSLVSSQFNGIPSNMNISCITVDPNDSNTWYIGTGEQYTAGAAVGNGVYKTTDGGTNWTNVPVQLAGGGSFNYSASNTFLSGNFFINDIIAWDNGSSTEIFIGVGAHVYGDSNNPSNWLGLQSAGLYRTIDEGSSWSRIESANMKFTSGIDYYFIPNDFEISSNNTLWMGTIGNPAFGNGGGRIFSSVNGTTWTEANGSPLSNSNRVELAVSSTNATKMYALTQGTTSAGPHIYASTNGFSSSIELPKPIDADTDIAPEDFTRGQDFYNLVIEVNPINDDIVYVGGIDLFMSIDSGSNWAQISKWSNNNVLSGLNCSLVHADQHTFTFKPDSPDEAVIGCDGGVYYASSLSTAETNNVISSRNKNYNVTQFYYGGYGQSASSELFLAGAQDNGTQYIEAATPGINSSVDVFGGDGAFSEIDQIGDSNGDGEGDYMIVSYVYNNHYYYDLTGSGSNYYIEDGDSEGDFINQADLDSNLDIMYSNGSNKINRYVLGNNSATKTQLTNSLLNSSPTAFKVSPYTTVSTTLLVGTENGKLIKLTNANNVNTGLVCWEDITGSSFIGSISSIEYGETENDIIVTFHNYGVTSIWYSSNGGSSWASKEGDLPDFPVKCLLQNPLSRNEVIIGTELGVWETKNFNEDTPIWTSSYNGMRDVKVVDLDLRTSDNSILATTFGRGLFTGTFTSVTSPTYTLASSNSVVEVCASATNAVFNFDYKALGGYSTATTISVSGIPSGAISNLSTSNFNSSNGTFTLTINNIGAVATGEHIITVAGTGDPNVSTDILLIIKDDVSNITTNLPIDGANQVSTTNTNLTWNEDLQANLYDVEISTDAGFNTIIESITTCNTYYTIGANLDLATVYYWKVRAKNDCNTGDFSETQRFITATLNDCTRPPDLNTTSVPINDGVIASSIINILDDFPISKVKVYVNITHTYISDFTITLKSPFGTSVLLFNGSCGDMDGLEVTYDDDAASPIICGSQPVTGTFIPEVLLAAFNSDLNSDGDWTLEIFDPYAGDSGVLNSWSLEFCTAQNITNSTFTNSPLNVGADSTYILNSTETNAISSGSTAVEQKFMLTQLPTKGNVKLNGVDLALGETFTQDDIDNNNVSYFNSSITNATDSFKVDITNATSGFLPNEQVNINITATALSVDEQFFEKTETSIFPTISNGTINILSNSSLGKTLITVHTINGKKVFEKYFHFYAGEQETIQLINVSTGMYIVKLSSENLQGSKKIIIK